MVRRLGVRTMVIFVRRGFIDCIACMHSPATAPRPSTRGTLNSPHVGAVGSHDLSTMHRERCGSGRILLRQRPYWRAAPSNATSFRPGRNLRDVSGPRTTDRAATRALRRSCEATRTDRLTRGNTKVRLMLMDQWWGRLMTRRRRLIPLQHTLPPQRRRFRQRRECGISDVNRVAAVVQRRRISIWRRLLMMRMHSPHPTSSMGWPQRRSDSCSGGGFCLSHKRLRGKRPFLRRHANAKLGRPRR